jgi:hypothetical protein
MGRSLRKLLDHLGGLPQRLPVNALLVGGDQVRVDADLAENLNQQRSSGRIVVVMHHRGADIEAASRLCSSLAHFTDERDGGIGRHALRVLRERLRRDPPSGAFKARFV